MSRSRNCHLLTTGKPPAEEDRTPPCLDLDLGADGSLRRVPQPRVCPCRRILAICSLRQTVVVFLAKINGLNRALSARVAATGTGH